MIPSKNIIRANWPKLEGYMNTEKNTKPVSAHDERLVLENFHK
jgi:hypothetical protein